MKIPKLSYLLTLLVLLFMFCNCGSDEPYGRLTAVSLVTDKDVIYKTDGSDIKIRIKIPSEHYVPQLSGISFVSTSHSITSSSNDIAGGILPESRSDIEVTGITPYVNPNGEQVPGEWLVMLKWNESNVSVAVLKGYLSVHHISTGWYEEDVTVRTSEMQIVNLPEPVLTNFNLNIPYAQTYKMKKTNGDILLNGAYIFVQQSDMMKEADAMGVDWIKSINVEILSDEYKSFFEIQVPVYNPDYGIYVAPVDEKLSTLSADKFPLIVPVRVVVEDAAGNKVTHEDVLRFGLGEVLIPATESKLNFISGGNEEKLIDIAPFLSKIGLTREFCLRYPQMAFFTATSSFAFYKGDLEEDVMGLELYLEEDVMDNYIKTGVFNISVNDWGLDQTNTDYQSYGTLTIGANSFSCSEEMDRLLINSTLVFEISVK